MSIINIIDKNIKEILKRENNSYINNIVENYLNYTNIILNRKREIVNIYGKLLSGKTTLKTLLINRLRKEYNGVNINIKNVSILDKYNEKETFDNILLFIKNTVNKNDIKVLIIDDFDSFTKLFQTKIECLLNRVQLSFIISSNVYFNNDSNSIVLNTYDFNNINEIYNTIIQNLNKNSRLKLNLNIKNIIMYLANILKTSHNIHGFMNNIELLQYTDTNIKDYNYLNLIENSYVYNILLNENTIKNLIKYLDKKNKNNENIKDCILLIEQNIYNIFHKNSAEKNNILTNLLDLCNLFKMELIKMIDKKKDINYKLLFNYFMIKIILLNV